VTKDNPNYRGDGGTLYFNDPWADLLPPADDKFCTASNPICWYAMTMQGKDPVDSGKMGNFEAFAKLTRPDNNLGPLKKVISIGGYGHDNTFEDSFNSQQHINNFVDSAAKIIENYHIDGIDLDYENPDMTHAQSDNFLQLVKALRAKLGPDKFIAVTILSGPNYIKGIKNGNKGFDPNTGVLAEIANYADKINLMTYDFHGAFDYDPGKGRTGFLTNLYMPTDAPKGYDAKFSVVTSVAALEQMGVAPEQITVGIPA